MQSMTNTDNIPEHSCDLCGERVVPGEHFTVSDGGLTVEHDACADDWFRRNYGREGVA